MSVQRAAAQPPTLENAITAACMVRVRGRVSAPYPSSQHCTPLRTTAFSHPPALALSPRPVQDPHRLKLAHHSFYQSVDGFLTLQCSGSLLVLSRSSSPHPHVHVLCAADILAPFLLSSPLFPLELLPDTSVTVLPSSSQQGRERSVWWECEVVRVEEVGGVQAAVDQLTAASDEWAVGWTPCTPPLPPCRAHSAGAFAVLKVLHVLGGGGESPHEPALMAGVRPEGFPAFPPFAFCAASGLRRGLDVTVIASPFGLLSPAVFQGSVSRGIISNLVYAYPVSKSARESTSAEGSGLLAHASFDSAAMGAAGERMGSFPSASDVSFPRQLHFPLQSSPAAGRCRCLSLRLLNPPSDVRHPTRHCC